MANIKLMVEGGKASTTPAMTQTVGPLKMDMQKMISDINEKTATYKGLQVPVELKIDEKDKTYVIIVKSPPTSELIKSKLKLAKGSGEPEKKKFGNISVEQLISIAQMKMESLFTTDLKSAIKSVAGTCNSMGVLVEGMTSNEFNKKMNEGKFDDIINNLKIEASPEKLKELNEQLVNIQTELDKVFAKKKKDKDALAPKVAAVEKKEGEGAKVEDKKEKSKEGKK